MAYVNIVTCGIFNLEARGHLELWKQAATVKVSIVSDCFLTFSLSPFAMARESSRLETLFDKQTSSSRGYVTEAYKIEEIVREWELQTKKRPKKTRKDVYSL